MYIPPHFAIKDTDALHRIIETHPLGVLVTQSPNGLDANHIPFELDRARGLLIAMWRAPIRSGANAAMVRR